MSDPFDRQWTGWLRPDGRKGVRNLVLVIYTVQCAAHVAHAIAAGEDDVQVIGALPPVGTFITGYRVHPFVGLIPDDLRFRPNPAEVAAVLLFQLEELRDGFAMRRLVRRGVPIRTPTYVVGDHLIWGATARILADLLARLDKPKTE